jgi:hypothetical protein
VEPLAIYEAQLSLTVSGVSNAIWTAYCLTRMIDNEADSLGDDSDYDDDGSVSDDSFVDDEAWDCHISEETYSDARRYWLECVKFRSRIIVREWREVVFALASEVRSVSFHF